MPTINLDLFPEWQQNQTPSRGTNTQSTQTTTSTRNTRTTTTQTNRNRTPIAPNNPRLDDDPPVSTPVSPPANQSVRTPVEPAVVQEDDETDNLPSWDPLEY
jgi:hypothetical protein